MPRGKSTSDDLRQRIVERRQLGESYQKIATALRVSKSTVQSVLKHHQSTGSLAPKKKTGRPRRLTWRDCARLRRYFRQNRNAGVKDIMEWCSTNLGKVLSMATVYRYVLRLKFRFYKAKHKPFMTPINKRRRLAWARTHLKWGIDKWSKVLWTDESYFRVVYGNNGCRVLRTKEEADNPDCYIRRVQKKSSICVWGGISASGMGPLHVCEGTVKSEQYIQILEQNLPGVRRSLFNNRSYTFQQDNAKPHTSRVTTAWFRRNRIKPMQWPANSPDLSPIENIWRYLKRKINQRRPKNVKQLEQYLKEEWNRVPVDLVRKQVNSMPRRLAAVIKWKGDVTKW